MIAMTHPRPLFYGDEAAILDAMYEVKNGTYDSYTLARKLKPTVQTSTPEGHTAFIKTREATEGLIIKNLVRGERLTGADGVYFNKLKLTPKGERAAIEQRQTALRTEKAMAETAKDTNAIEALMNADGKNES
jgi:hypothetical protein